MYIPTLFLLKNQWKMYVNKEGINIIDLFLITISIILLVLCFILFVLLRYATKVYYKELDASANNIVNKYIFTEFFKQITELLPKETIIICLGNAIKICENNDLIQFDILSKNAMENIKIEQADRYNIAAKVLYKHYTENDIRCEEKGDH